MVVSFARFGAAFGFGTVSFFGGITTFAMLTKSGGNVEIPLLICKCDGSNANLIGYPYMLVLPDK